MTDTVTSNGAAALGRLGGIAKAKAMTAKQKADHARKMARARWRKRKKAKR